MVIDPKNMKTMVDRLHELWQLDWTTTKQEKMNRIQKEHAFEFYSIEAHLALRSKELKISDFVCFMYDENYNNPDGNSDILYKVGYGKIAEIVTPSNIFEEIIVKILKERFVVREASGIVRRIQENHIQKISMN